MKKLIAALLFALASASPAVAAPCGPIPALPDTTRRTEYTGIVAQTGPFPVNFQLYGDQADYGAWLSVWVNGVAKTAVTDFVVTSSSGALGSLCLPITDAQVTFTAPQTGTIEIEGGQRPRRLSEFSENAGVTAHALNQVFNTMTAQLRERWDRESRLIRSPPGEALSVLPPAASRVSGILGFDATGLVPTMLSPSTGLGTVIGPATTVVGHVVIWNSTNGTIVADGAATVALGTNNIWTGTNTFAPASGVPITITGASGLTRALDLTQTFTGTDTVTHQLNNIAITDSADLGANVGNGLNIFYSYGGGTAKGSRQALQAGIALTAPTNSANTKHFYAAAQFGASASSGDNGTNTGAGAKGSIIALNPDCTLSSGAVNLAECSGIQITMHSLAGSSVSQRSGLQIADLSGAGGVQGATFDDAIVMGNVIGSPGWKIGWAFDCTNFGSCPIATTGTAIKTVGAQTMDTFLDASSATVTTFINGPGGNFVVDNNGSTQIKSISAFGWVGNFSRILSPGDGVVLLQDHLNSTFGRLQLGGTTSSFPSIKRNAAALNFRLADDSADAAITAGASTLATLQIGNTAPAGNNLVEISIATLTGRFLSIRNNTGGSANQAQFGIDGAGVMVLACAACTATQFGTQTTVALNLQTNNANRLIISGDRSHGSWSGTAPGLSSCGTSPSISGNDMQGTVTMGTGSPAGCTITFAATFGSAPNCAVSWRANLASMAYTVSTSALTLTQTATSSNVVDYQCRGN